MGSAINNSTMYGLVVIAGFIILGAAIAYAMARNKRSSRQERQTEEATRRLYDEPGDEASR